MSMALLVSRINRHLKERDGTDRFIKKVEERGAIPWSLLKPGYMESMDSVRRPFGIFEQMIVDGISPCYVNDSFSDWLGDMHEYGTTF